MTEPTVERSPEPRTQAGREFLGNLVARFGGSALDPVSFDLTRLDILAIEAEAALVEVGSEPSPEAMAALRDQVEKLCSGAKFAGQTAANQGEVDRMAGAAVAFARVLQLIDDRATEPVAAE